jgi:hypothetical protein
MMLKVKQYFAPLASSGKKSVIDLGIKVIIIVGIWDSGKAQLLDLAVHEVFLFRS